MRFADASGANARMQWQGEPLESAQELTLPYWLENTRLHFNITCELAWTSLLREARLRTTLSKKLRTIHYGMDATPFAEARDELRTAVRRRWGVAPDELVIGFAGRFVPQKSIDTLLRGFAFFSFSFAQRTSSARSALGFFAGRFAAWT